MIGCVNNCIIFFIFSSSLIISLNKDFYDRNVTQTINQIFGNTNVSAEKSYFLDHYGILHLTAFEIIKQHPFLGTGQKTFRLRLNTASNFSRKRCTGSEKIVSGI